MQEMRVPSLVRELRSYLPLKFFKQEKLNRKVQLKLNLLGWDQKYVMGYEKELCNKLMVWPWRHLQRGAFWGGLVNVDSAQLGWLGWCSFIPNIQSLFSWYQRASLHGLLKVMGEVQGTLGKIHKASWGSGSGWVQYDVGLIGKNKSQVQTPNQESQKYILPKSSVHCTVRWKEVKIQGEVKQHPPNTPNCKELIRLSITNSSI